MQDCRILAGAALLMTAGCGSPETSTPIALQASNYGITASGAILGIGGKTIEQSSRCIGSGNSAEHIPTMLVRPYMAISEECGTAKFERTGNKLTGVSVCPLDPEIADGTTTVTFEGEIKPDRVEGELRMKLDISSEVAPEIVAAQKLMGAASIPFTAIRSGDCSASGSAANSNGPAPTFEESEPQHDLPEPPEE